MQVAPSSLATNPAPPLLRAPERRHCTVILASGAGDGGMRATLAFTAALTAASMDQPTLVFLAGDGAHWGYEGRADGVRVRGFPALAGLIEAFLEAGGRSACAHPATMRAACRPAARPHRPRGWPGCACRGCPRCWRTPRTAAR